MFDLFLHLPYNVISRLAIMNNGDNNDDADDNNDNNGNEDNSVISRLAMPSLSSFFFFYSLLQVKIHNIVIKIKTTNGALPWLNQSHR